MSPAINEPESSNSDLIADSILLAQLNIRLARTLCTAGLICDTTMVALTAGADQLAAAAAELSAYRSGPPQPAHLVSSKTRYHQAGTLWSDSR